MSLRKTFKENARVIRMGVATAAFLGVALAAGYNGQMGAEALLACTSGALGICTLLLAQANRETAPQP